MSNGKFTLPSAKEASLGLRRTGDFLSKSGWSLVNKEQEMKESNWYERGELPPVGTVCELIWCGVPQGDVEIIAYRNNDSKVVFWHNGRDNVLAAEITTTEFRPLRTETDKLVEQAMSLFSETESTTDAQEGIEHAVRKLIEQGYRKVKPMSKDEFVQESLKCFSSIRSDVGKMRLICDSLRKLHSAGCRFIDKGDNDE